HDLETGCSLDTRTVLWVGNDLLESITVGDRYYNYLYPGGGGQRVDSSGDLDQISRYTGPDGPCGPGLDCRFETRTLYFDDAGDLVESITADGRHYTYVFPGGQGNGNLLPSGDNRLTSVGRYHVGPLYTALFDPLEWVSTSDLGATWQSYEWGVEPSPVACSP
ncbi:MAG: hypothetical protein AAFY88_14230, partial [Acidobacteriota bacterium]